MAKKWDVNKTKCPQNKINFTVRVNEKIVKVNNDSYSGTHIICRRKLEQFKICYIIHC